MEPTYSESLQLNFNEEYTSLTSGYQKSEECLVAIIEDHLQEFSPIEMANLVWHHPGEPCFIFIKGNFQVVEDWDGRWAWEEESYEGEMSGDPVDDLVISEIIRIMKNS